MVDRKLLSNSASFPEMTYMWLSRIVAGHHWDTFLYITVSLKQELLVLVVGCLPLDVNEAEPRNILSKTDGI